MPDEYDPSALRVLEGMTPLRRPAGHADDAADPAWLALPPEERTAVLERAARISGDLSQGDMIALAVWRLGLRARDLAAKRDPGAPAAEAAYRQAEAAAIEAGHLMRRVDAADLRARYPVLARDAEITIGVGWQPLLESVLDWLAGMAVVVRLVREKAAGLDVKIYPRGSWRPEDFEAVGPVRERAVETSLRTCEACGAPGTVRRVGRWRTRCDAHAEL